MRVLYLSTWFPYPPDNGSRIRVYHLSRALAQKHPVHLIAFMPTAAETRFIPVLESWCAQVSVVQRDPFWLDRRKAIRGLLSTSPRHVVAGHSPELARMVSDAVRRQRYDLVIASCATVAPYAALVPGAGRILEEHNFMARWMEEQYREQRSLAKRVLRWLTWQKCRYYERRLYRNFDAVTMVSEPDRAAVESAIPACAGRVHVIPNGVDLEYHRPGLAEPVPDRLVFNGALTYSANADAMHYLVTEVLPLVRQQRPATQLYITGRSDGVDLSWMPHDGSVILTGYLEDVRPAVASAWACVAPLRSGGGTRIKILEALALGTPVVATTKGAEGIDVTPEQDILVADEPREFAAQTVRLLTDASLRQRLAENGRRLVEAQHEWQGIGHRFCELAAAVAGERSRANAQ